MLGLSPSQHRAGEFEVKNSSAVLLFNQGSTLIFPYEIYNAKIDKATSLPRLTTQIRIFRDGKLVYTGDPKPLDVAGQKDLQRIDANARLQLGPELPPGEYVFQIIAGDQLADEKHRMAMQWIDFEVVK